MTPKTPTARTKPRKSNARATKHALSKTLKVHRWQLDQFLALTGAPKPDDARTYDVAEVAEFIATHRSTGSLDELRAARLEEVKLKCARLKIELERDEGLWVRRSEIDLLHGRMAHGLRSLLYSRLEGELPQHCAGFDALALRKYCRNMADELVGKLAGDVASWAPTGSTGK
jgi:hypothetical protein